MPGGQRVGTSTRSRTGSGALAAIPDRAASRPRSSSTAGCRPRTSWRSSARASVASSWACSMTWRTGSGASARLALAMPSCMASETSRRWAPSCRSRSMRRRSASVAATISARLRASDSTRSSSSSPRLGPSRARPAASSARATALATHGATSSRAADSAGLDEADADPPAVAQQAGQPGGGQDRRQPAGRHQDAAEGPADQGQQVVAELAPGRRGPPGPDRPQRPGAGGGRGRRRDVDPEHGPEPGPLERAEPARAPGQQHRPGQGDGRVEQGTPPAADRPVDQAPDRGQPDEDQRHQHRADGRTGHQAGEGVQRRPPAPPVSSLVMASR